MYSISDDFKRALGNSQRVATKCEVYDSSGSLITELPVTGGSVNIDRDASNRRRCNVKLNGSEFVPSELSGILHTSSNNEIKLYRGLVLRDTTTELVPLGVFGIENTDIEDSGEDISITVKGFDRSKEIERRRFTELYYIAQGTNYGTAMKDLIDSAMPGLKYNFPSVDETTPSMVLGEGGWSGGGDPWSKALEMAESIGMQLFFDADGSLRLQPEPDPSSDPIVWDYIAGEDSTLLYVSRGISKEEVFNHVVVVGNHSGLFAPIRAEAWDDDPESPTFVDTYGHVPTFHRSTMIFSQAQAEKVAEAQLLRHLGTPENVRFISIVNPAHEVGDVVRIRRRRAGVDAVYVLDQLNVPLDYTGSLNATTRERRVR